jgi:excinuclease ABC subunit C
MMDRSSQGVRPGGSDTNGNASRIEQPQPPPMDRRGGSGLAFGVLRADADPALALSESELSVLEADAEAGAQEPASASDEFPARPDLVLIDGGRGQLSVAREVLEKLGITGIPLVGVAKGPDRDAGREHFHFPDRDKPLLLEPRDPVLYFVQRLRDEAHRFAIGTHRAKRSKAIGANPLDEIGGIGPTRKRALLEHFGSAKAVSRASPDDLRAVAGISAQMAQSIYDFFHERRE